MDTPIESIRRHARRLGFTVLGTAPAGPLPTYDRFERWIDEGMHGAMGYMERRAEERRDVRNLWPEARSVVVLALDYRAERTRSEPLPPNTGVISSYAWGDDYHEWCWDALDRLANSIRDDLGDDVRAKGYVDTGPLLERDLGQQAGLGWHGKNTMLINPERGSWFFLAELLINIDLPLVQTRIPDRCGSCRRCLDACPTQTFRAPHVLDARRCISYLTIEHRGSIPRDLRPLIGAHIFGCDMCQDVCPWNRKAERIGTDATVLPIFNPRPGLREPDLLPYVSITSADFRERFMGSPIMRAGRRGFVRNVCVALGNVGDARAVEVLTDAVSDASPLVREHAAWALMRVAGRNAVPVLRRALDTETDAKTKTGMLHSLREAESGPAGHV